MGTRTFVAIIGLAALICNACGGSPTEPTSTFDLRGTVTGYEGAPLQGATLELIDGVNKGKIVATDAQGRYGFTDLEAGVLTIKASAVDYAAATKPVTLAADLAVDFQLRVLLAQIAIVGTITPISHPADTFGAQFQIANTGDGCAADITGTVDFLNGNRALVTSLAWSAPPNTMLRPGDRSTYEFCCLGRDQAAAVTTYNVNFKWVTVHCT